ncbi:Tegument antigen [Schistosoma japonicum]|uniref:SJCHGC00558 protein n=1 Tax=Schistosoma japonicum TaxID=6182 RepID=Q5DBG1_SCHJA|nr:SJCHGC00558 protein [Schistosoma japonicum]TNN11878.1 Tegument antigen [Schistosoma japonicum]TNN11879.1 Tegument antigen [Schistosoma japonicum]TNN11880.1 Tegument antigen [Schistosoma japonicum]CAX82517.1 Tegument antigen (I(H)A) [Schistosoma japonicum]
MERLIEIFFELDKDNNEIVDKQELINYCQANKLDMKMVDEWLSKCDTDKNNKITFDEFCRGFGIKLNEMRVEKVERALIWDKVEPVKLTNVNIIKSTMSETKQTKVIETFDKLMQQYGNSESTLDKVSSGLKKFLEETYGNVWHVLIMNGSFWMSYSHEPFCSLQFKKNNYSCSIWRTPNGQRYGS